MPARLTLHPPQRASRFLLIREGDCLVVGRDAECGLVLEDAVVSKRHARLEWDGSGWRIEDLGSKNGTSVDGVPADNRRLASGAWISFGGLMARFETITTEEAERLDAHRLARLQTSLAMRRRLGARLDPVDLLLRYLHSTMEVAGAERGFILVVGPDGVSEHLVFHAWDAAMRTRRMFIDRLVWTAEGPVTEPVIEAVMIGLSGTHGISFVSPGRTLRRQ